MPTDVGTGDELVDAALDRWSRRLGFEPDAEAEGREARERQAALETLTAIVRDLAADADLSALLGSLDARMDRERAAAGDGVELEVVDLRTLVPMDKTTVLESVKKTGKVILLHEDTRTGGFAGELAALIAEEVFEYLDGPVMRITAPDTPIPYSPPLEEFFLPKTSDVIRVARHLAAY